MARNMVGVPYENPARYVGPGRDLIPIIKVSRAPTTSDTKYPLGQFWLVGDSPSTGTVGDLWYLCDFLAGVPQWCQIAVGAGAPGIDFLRDQVDAQAGPDASGNVDIDGLAVANSANPSGIPLESVAGTNKIDLQLQVAAARTGAPGDKNDAGICSFDDTSFSVDADGYVTLAGGAGPAVDTVNVDTNTGPGTNPVVPDGSGELTVLGNTVANAANAEPVYTHSRAANAYNIEVQVATAVNSAPGDKLDAGLASFKSGDFDVDADGFVSLGAASGSQGITCLGCSISNIGFTLSTQTLTVQGADGTALSASNPGYVLIEDPANANQLKLFEITANQAMTNTEMDGNTFGITSGVDWGEDLPLYVYAMTNDASDSIQFALGRIPHLKTSPGSADIGDPSAANADEQYSLYSFDDITEADWDGNPCACIGSLRATWAQASTRWTFTTMDNMDGVNKYNDDREFIMPIGQNGADAAGYFELNGGTTIPVFTNNAPKYYTSRDGICTLNVWHNGDGGQDGSGAVVIYWCAPYTPPTTGANDSTIGSGAVNAGNGTIQVSALAFQTDGSHRVQLDRTDTGNSTQLGDYTNGARYFSFAANYLIGVA